MLTLLNYQSPRYRGPLNKPDSVTQKIIGWQSVWGFFDIPRNKGGKFLNNLWFCVFQIPTVLTSAFHSTNLFLFSLHERLKLGRQLLNFLRWTIYVVNSVENTYPFSIFLLVPGKIYSEVRQLEIFLLFSRFGTLQEKYFGFPQSLTHFVGWYLTNVLANFHENPRNLQTP